MSRSYLLMGILNVTPDSFSDGGCFEGVDSAVAHALKMADEGADIVDVGGASSRPGAMAVSVEQELSRVAPVIERLARLSSVRISVDTRHYEVAREAVCLGASMLNDISGGEDLRMAALASENDLQVCLMHMRGTPETMQDSPAYPMGVVETVKGFLSDRVRAFERLGVARERIWVDPGIGFGKTLDHNLELIRRLDEFNEIGSRVVIGTSRKSFLAQVLNDPALDFELRREGNLAASLCAYGRGATVFRVHEVASTARALRTWESIIYGSNSDRVRQ